MNSSINQDPERCYRCGVEPETNSDNTRTYYLWRMYLILKANENNMIDFGAANYPLCVRCHELYFSAMDAEGVLKTSPKYETYVPLALYLGVLQYNSFTPTENKP